MKEGKKHIDFYHPTNKTLLIAATQLGIELPRGKIPVDQLDSIINIPEVKKNVSDKIEQLAKERNELRDLVEHKKEKEINKKLIVDLNKILKSLEDPNLELLASKVKDLNIPEEKKSELFEVV